MSIGGCLTAVGTQPIAARGLSGIGRVTIGGGGVADGGGFRVADRQHFHGDRGGAQWQSLTPMCLAWRAVS